MLGYSKVINEVFTLPGEKTLRIHSKIDFCKTKFVRVKNVLKFVRHHSWLELFRRIWLATIKIFFESRSMIIMRLAPEENTGPEASIDAKELKLTDIDAMLEAMYLSRTDIHNRFNKGDRCFAILDGSKIASYFWALFDVRHLEEIHWEFDLKPTQTWLFNAVTIKNVRGRGYYPNLFRYIAQVLRTENFYEVFIDAEERNKASIRGLEKAGCRRVVKIKMKKLLSKVGYKVTIFDRVAWQRLSDPANNSARKKYIKEEMASESYDS